jgi:hypothetical protein
MEQRYNSGEEIHIGDRIRYAGDHGTIVFGVDRNEYSAAFPEKDWSHHGTGFMVQNSAYGLVMLEKADEDLEFLGRATQTI